MKALTLEKKLQIEFNARCNRLRSQILFHKIHTWEEVFKELGHKIDKVPEESLTITSFNTFVAKLQEDLKKPVEIKPQEPVAADDLIIPPPNPLQTASLFPFQEKVSKELLASIVMHKHSAGLLNASVGVGKTFIFFQLIRWLRDLNWHENKSFGPWPYMVITKASVIQQTRRVGEAYFGLKHNKEFLVTNYDALRSSFGMNTLIREENLHLYGEEITKYVWMPFIHPCFIVWDEGQAVKNEGSLQSRITQAFNDLKDANTYQLYSSATIFTRVCEAKCFAVACRIKLNEF